MHRIAVIPGDGIGKEVVSEGVKCLNALCEVFEDLDKRGASIKSIVTLYSGSPFVLRLTLT